MTGWLSVLGLSKVFAELRANGIQSFSQPLVRSRILVCVATALVVAYAVGVLTYVMITPEVGVRSAFTPVVNHFYPSFLYPPDQRNTLRDGDLIIQVGDKRIHNWSEYLRAVAELKNEAAPTVNLEQWREWQADASERAPLTFVRLDGHPIVRVVYDRQGAVGDVWCRYGQSPVETLVPTVLWFFLKIGLFAVGAVVYWKRPADQSAAQFFLFCTMSFGAYLGGYHWSRIVTQPALLIVFMMCSIFLPAVSLHFYLVFPRAKSILAKWPRLVPAIIYAPPLIFFLLTLTNYCRIRLTYPSDVTWLLEEIKVEILIYFGVASLWYVLSLVSQIFSYRNAVDATERNQVKWILFGTLSSIVPIGYSLYLALFEGARFAGGAATWPMFAASACVTIAYTISITRYRLMQLDQIVSSGMVYFLVSTLAAAVYYGLVFAAMVLLGRRAGEGPALWQALGVAGTALVVMLALDLARSRIKAALDRHFRREKHQLDRTWARMSEAIEQLVDPATLARRLLHTAADLLNAKTGAIYLRQDTTPLYLLIDSLGEPPALTELASGCPLVEDLQEGGTLSVRSFDSSEAARRQLRFLGGAAAHALWHEGQLLGILLLGPKRASAYTEEDFQLLAAFSQLTVLALVSAEGRRSIEALNRELQGKVEKIAEQQRRIVNLQSQLQRGNRSSTERNGSSAEPIAAAAGKSEGAATAAEPETAAQAPLPLEGLVGSGPQVRQLLQLIRKVAASESSVLLRGESGTGKELLARALHENSPRADKPLVKVHCAALSPGLLESELFGHVKGAFTYAIRDKIGRFEAANGGTLFLDEIGDISLDVQVKLLRVLQEKTFERVGSSEPVKVDVRVIAATHQDLERLIREGRFREDLFYRLNVLPIQVPPLRERLEDIPELAMHFLQLYAKRTNKPVAAMDDDALALLKSYSWPGNIRQLENVIERAVVIAEDAVITVAELSPELKESKAAASSAPVLPSLVNGNGMQSINGDREKREREFLARVLAQTGGNKAEAARSLGLARSTLLSRLKKLGLN